ncbi:MAG: bifunctional diaminohydroxyphosphoribosylaminopyrimidine deaminase/5-amino-6-(5-phosphoribosylamino)uracil reductase RibD [Sphingobacteriales bacterium]|nr:bifunctional diaminohydroxyphosphoribosylaminopyrimidine deaminase/5-amino-6-(5-phosphoribosylamino)uracil reductase RibD [Sphingobacteriales bacterium]
MTDKYDSIYMQRCLELAAQAQGNTYPNPLVGAVVVHNNKIIGEGYHHQKGLPHAEVNAIQSILPINKHLLSQSTLYVNLEPCSHYGSTPPCAHFIIKHQIPKVVLACRDPFDKVSGKGIAILLQAGIEVVEGVEHNAARLLNRRFFTYIEQKIPYIILKWAQTQDSFFAPNTPQQQWISNALTKRVAHRWRTQEQAVLIGTHTALIDNPQLTARYWQGKNPLRCVVDKSLQLPLELSIFNHDAPTLIFTDLRTPVPAYSSMFHIQYQKIDFQEDIIKQIIDCLYSKNIQSLIVEGGAELINSFLTAGIWHEARVFEAPVHWGKGKRAPLISTTPQQSHQIGDNFLFTYFNPTHSII